MNSTSPSGMSSSSAILIGCWPASASSWTRPTRGSGGVTGLAGSDASPTRADDVEVTAGGVDGPGGVIDKEGLVRCHRLLRLHPIDRLISHVNREVVSLRMRRSDAGDSVIDQRIPLIGLSPDKAVELVETLMSRPAVKRPRDTGFPRRRFMPLAESTGAVAIEPEHLGQGRDAIWKRSCIAWKCRCSFHDGTGITRMVVTAGLERHPRR